MASGRFESRDDWTTYHDWLTYSLAIQLNFYLYAFKQSSYASEQEIRFIYMTELDEPHPFDGPYVRQFGTMMKPYIVLDFSSAELAEVVYGPNSDPVPTEAWLRSLLDANGHHECTIRPAKIAPG